MTDIVVKPYWLNKFKKEINHKNSRIIELETENAKLREALKPFVDELEAQETEVPSFTDDDDFIHSYGIKLRHLRRARDVLKNN